MASASGLRQQAAVIANVSTDPNVQKLARIVEQLCACVDDVEREARDAQDKAKQASHDAQDAKRGR